MNTAAVTCATASSSKKSWSLHMREAAVATLDSETSALAQRRKTWRTLRDAGHLLDTLSVASFVARGFLRFDAIVPEAVNRAVLSDIAAGVQLAGGYDGRQCLDDLWPGQAMGEVFRLPAVQGLIASLVGPNPIHDHHHLHIVPARSGGGPGAWHQDAVVDTRSHFDIQLMYFPQETTREMGGTVLLPGSHLRIVNVDEITMYQNFRGQTPTICPAGTIVATHHGIWHGARPNHTDRTRYMFKLRLNPAVRQERLWDDRNYPSEQAITETLSEGQPWYDTQARLEQVNRARLWRQLTADPSYDLARWLGRLENDPHDRIRSCGTLTSSSTI
jgi:hypothetical protein